MWYLEPLLCTNVHGSKFEIGLDYEICWFYWRFLHAMLPDDLPMFSYLPRGFFFNMQSITGKRTGVLSVKKLCYGKVVVPHLWFERLMKALLKMGFVLSSYDICFLLKKDMMIVAYVDDDCGISASDPSMLDQLINDLWASQRIWSRTWRWLWNLPWCWDPQEASWWPLLLLIHCKKVSSRKSLKLPRWPAAAPTMFLPPQLPSAKTKLAKTGSIVVGISPISWFSLQLHSESQI